MYPKNEILTKTHDEFRELEKQLEKKELTMPIITEDSSMQQAASSSSQQPSQPTGIDENVKRGEGEDKMIVASDNVSSINASLAGNGKELLPTEKERGMEKVEMSSLKRSTAKRQEEDSNQTAIIRSEFDEPDLATLRHPVNPNIHAVGIWPLVPSSALHDDSMLEKEYVECSFDMINTFQDLPQKSLLKTMNDPERNTSLIWYYKEKENEDERCGSTAMEDDDNDNDQNKEECYQSYEYVRDYDMQRIDKSSTMAIFMKEDKNGNNYAYYAPINTVFSLKKKRMTSGMSGGGRGSSDAVEPIEHINYLIKRIE